jgi:hypothetical protein
VLSDSKSNSEVAALGAKVLNYILKGLKIATFSCGSNVFTRISMRTY